VLDGSVPARTRLLPDVSGIACRRLLKRLLKRLLGEGFAVAMADEKVKDFWLIAG